MSPNLLYFFLAVIFILVMIYIVKDFRRSLAETEIPLKSKHKQLNVVEGILTFDGLEIPTFEPGILSYDDLVEIHFGTVGAGHVKVVDVYFNGRSLFQFNNSYSYKEKITSAVSIIEETHMQGAVSKALLFDVKLTLAQLDEFNKYITEGNLYKDSRGTFRWRLSH